MISLSYKPSITSLTKTSQTTVTFPDIVLITLHARNEFCGSADTSADVSNHDHFMIA